MSALTVSGQRVWCDVLELPISDRAEFLIRLAEDVARQAGRTAPQPAVTRTRRCADCDASLQGKHPNRRRCGPCRRRHNSAREEARRQRSRDAVPRFCLDCGASLQRTHALRQRCDSCRAAHDPHFRAKPTGQHEERVSTHPAYLALTTPCAPHGIRACLVCAHRAKQDGEVLVRTTRARARSAP